jgi:hypothetical protein
MTAHPSRRGLGIAVGVAALVVIALGLYLAGSPAEARVRRFDERRVDDLRTAGYSIDAYWNAHGRLPLRLDSLPGLLESGRGLRDPVTDSAYAYTAGPDSSYQLCATFARASDEEPYSIYSGEWQHPAGRHCFSRTPSVRR